MASKRRLRKRQCEGKIRYTTMEQAIAQAKNLRRRSGIVYDAYKCPHACGGFHVGRRTDKVNHTIKTRRNIGK